MKKDENVQCLEKMVCIDGDVALWNHTSRQSRLENIRQMQAINRGVSHCRSVCALLLVIGSTCTQCDVHILRIQTRPFSNWTLLNERREGGRNKSQLPISSIKLTLKSDLIEREQRELEKLLFWWTTQDMMTLSSSPQFCSDTKATNKAVCTMTIRTWQNLSASLWTGSR